MSMPRGATPFMPPPQGDGGGGPPPAPPAPPAPSQPPSTSPGTTVGGAGTGTTVAPQPGAQPGGYPGGVNTGNASLLPDYVSTGIGGLRFRRRFKTPADETISRERGMVTNVVARRPGMIDRPGSARPGGGVSLERVESVQADASSVPLGTKILGHGVTSAKSYVEGKTSAYAFAKSLIAGSAWQASQAAADNLPHDWTLAAANRHAMPHPTAPEPTNLGLAPSSPIFGNPLPQGVGKDGSVQTTLTGAASMVPSDEAGTAGTTTSKWVWVAIAAAVAFMLFQHRGD